MRGSPLLNALIAFVAIALIGIPVRQLTRATAVAVATPAAVTPSPAAKVSVVMDFTVPPKSVRIRHLEKVVWSADTPGAKAEAELALTWPAEGVDLLIEIAWPDDAPLSAARVVATDPKGDEQTRSIWGRGSTSEVLTFQ